MTLSRYWWEGIDELVVTPPPVSHGGGGGGTQPKGRGNWSGWQGDAVRV